MTRTRPPSLLLVVFLLTSVQQAAPASVGSAWFRTGQSAKLMLSGAGFDKTYGPLIFNHPGGIATDGTRLLLADGNNNRVLVWNTLPAGNVRPDLLLGQRKSKKNAPGTGRNEMNWPRDVAIAKDKVVVADTYNDRILIWESFPTRNRQPADLSIDLTALVNPDTGPMGWPWAVWTDGNKLLVTATTGAKVLVWNTFPTADDQPPDYFLRANDQFGTPRTLATDGASWLVVGDHNAQGQSSETGNFFWSTFPTSDKPFDFFMENPWGGELMWGGNMTGDGKFILLTTPTLSFWNAFPTAGSNPDLLVGLQGGSVPHHAENWMCSESGFPFMAGDSSGVALTPSGKLYASLYNYNKIVVFNELPTSATQCPDFAIGSRDIDTHTLVTKNILTNPTPATDGRRLFVSSDFDRKLYVWKRVPKKSGTAPSRVYALDFAPWDNALHDGTFIIGGKQTVQVWTTLPLAGNVADMTFDGAIGSVSFGELRGVALDDRYLYLGDAGEGKLHVWPALPAAADDPLFTLEEPDVWRLSSDGTRLAVTRRDAAQIAIYDVAGLSANAAPAGVVPPDGAGYRLNLPNGVLVVDGRLFIGDTNFNRVLAWRSVQDALDGKDPDAILGDTDLGAGRPAIGSDTLFWPGPMAYDGRTLWAGEFKFSQRLVAFRR